MEDIATEYVDVHVDSLIGVSIPVAVSISDELVSVSEELSPDADALLMGKPGIDLPVVADFDSLQIAIAKDGVHHPNQIFCRILNRKLL